MVSSHADIFIWWGLEILVSDIPAATSSQWRQNQILFVVLRALKTLHYVDIILVEILSCLQQGLCVILCTWVNDFGKAHSCWVVKCFEWLKQNSIYLQTDLKTKANKKNLNGLCGYIPQLVSGKICPFCVICQNFKSVYTLYKYLYYMYILFKGILLILPSFPNSSNPTIPQLSGIFFIMSLLERKSCKLAFILQSPVPPILSFTMCGKVWKNNADIFCYEHDLLASCSALLFLYLVLLMLLHYDSHSHQHFTNIV